MKRGTKALLFFLSPFIGLIGALILYAITQAVLSSMDPENIGSVGLLLGHTGNMILGLLGVISIVMFPVGWGYGIYLISTDKKETSS
jgi:hypothetical protein